MNSVTDELKHFSKAVEALLISHSASSHRNNSDNPVKWKSIDSEKSQVVKPDRRCRDSDFTISAALVQLALPEKQQVSSFVQHLETEGQKWTLPVCRCFVTSKGLLSIKLHRPTVFPKAIAEVLEEGDKYGCGRTQDSEVEILLNNVTSLSSVEKAESSDASEVDGEAGLSELRAALFSEQLKNVLQILGFSVHEVNHPTSAGLQSVFETFGISLSAVPTNEERRSLIRCKLVERAAACKYRILDPKGESVSPKLTGEGRNASQGGGEDRGGEDGGGGREDRVRQDEELMIQSPRCSSVTLDLRRFASDSGLAFGKGNFDKNIHLAKVINEDGRKTQIIHQCVGLEEAYQKLGPKTSKKVLHITTKNKQFHQQQVDIAWRIVSYTELTNTSQLHAVCGPVLTRKSEGCDGDVNVEEFYRKREAQTRDASVMKYGEDVKGTHWEEVIRHLTIAGIKFELLGMQLNNQVKLDMSDMRENTSWPDSRDGVFVMYNYARLATLFTNYDGEVSNGVYPSLPSLGSIDFSTLREDQEWALIFYHILQYPSLLQDIRHQVMTNSGPRVNLQTHKICGFLVSLSRDLSSYYSHVHILGGGHTHLLPVMFARIYLMKAVQQVIRNGLALLNIRPLEQM